MDIEFKKHYFDSDISVSINLTDKLKQAANEHCYITLRYFYDKLQKKYRLADDVEIVNLVVQEEKRNISRVKNFTIDSSFYNGDFSARENDALHIACSLLPDLKLRRKIMN